MKLRLKGNSIQDFACIDRPLGEEADDAYAFPNPSTLC